MLVKREEWREKRNCRFSLLCENLIIAKTATYNATKLKEEEKIGWNGQTETEGKRLEKLFGIVKSNRRVTRRSRQPHQFTCVPYVGTWFIGGFDIDVAYQIKDLGNIAVCDTPMRCCRNLWFRTQHLCKDFLQNKHPLTVRSCAVEIDCSGEIGR